MPSPVVRMSEVSPAQRRTLIAAGLGWMLDAFDVMLYAMVLAHIMRDLGMTKGTAGFLNTLTLLASGIGGVLFGFLADRVGRKRALMLSILTYSVCSFASGLSTSITMLAAFRFVLGLGMGGEWNTGATLVAETWPDNLRARAMALVQSSWAIGYAAAALVAGLVLRHYNWRAVFFVGILPALVTLWIRKDVPESEMWAQRREGMDRRPVETHPSRAARVEGGAPSARVQTAEAVKAVAAQAPVVTTGFAELFSPRFIRQTFGLLLLNFFGLFAYWGLFSWIPAYLSLPVSQGGRGFGLMNTTTLLLVLNLAGMLPGYLCFGWFADRIGRRGAFMLYLFTAAALVPIYSAARHQWALLLMGALVGFFGTGFFSGSGLIGSEIFPTAIRARALGFTYNGARTLSALAPFVIGWVGQTKGLDWAFYLSAAAFLGAGLMAMTLPETRGRALE